MNPERWQQVKEIFHSALQKDRAERSAYLGQACQTDPSLKREVESLLASRSAAEEDFLKSAPPERAWIANGTCFGSYEILGLIGSGGMGEVYRARDKVLDRDVAIKVLPSALTPTREQMRRFEQEARAAAALNHPNILAIHQLGTYEEAPYLVMELLDGVTLREQLTKGPLPPRTAVDYGVQIAHGLTAAHEKGIVHRDLKPENVFVTKDRRVKILDFGLAKLTQKKESDAGVPTVGTESGLVMGTAGYMAPEQVRGEAVDHRADIFACGAILYEALTGERAFRKPTSAETMSAILNEEPRDISALAPAVPLPLKKAVERCLNKKPEHRFQSASDLAFALEALSESGTSSATMLAPHKRLGNWMYAVGCVLIIAVGFAVFWLRPRGALVPSTDWGQLTNFADAVSQPALSPDGRMLTFVRGVSTFLAPGEIYIKMLPSGQPVQLTHDSLPKMSPVFSPDGSRIAYTVYSAPNWDTWVVPVLGGEPERWLPNASGLVWINPDHVMFSELRSGEHMALVTSTESRGESRDVYFPSTPRGMAHRSYPSPDGQWVLLAEMDKGEWLPCRVVPLNGANSGHNVGFPDMPCTNGAWSPDGKWIYLSLHGKDTNFHIWRQRFPNGSLEQVTSGPADTEGITVAPDGKSLITSLGLRQRTVSLHRANEDRRISLEGYAYRPYLSPDEKKLYYRVLKGGTSPALGASELWVADTGSARTEPLLPGTAVTWYDLSQDGKQIVFSGVDSSGKSRLWIAPTDRSSVPRQIANAEGDMPFFVGEGELVFHGFENGASLAFLIREDGSEKRELTSTEVNEVRGVSPDGKFVIVGNSTSGISTSAVSSSGGAPLPILNTMCFLRWQKDRKLLYLSVATGMQSAAAYGRTYVIPVSPEKLFPPIPAGGFHSETEIAKLPGVSVIDASDIFPGSAAGTYAYSRQSVQRNLYRVPLP